MSNNAIVSTPWSKSIPHQVYNTKTSRFPLGFATYNLRRYPEARAALEKYLAFARDAHDYYAVSQLINSLPPDPEELGE